MKIAHPLPLVVVVWDDAWVRADEPLVLNEVSASHKPMTVHTIGWLLMEDERGVSVANEFYEETYRGRTFIPRAMVRTVTKFALAKPRKKR